VDPLADLLAVTVSTEMKPDRPTFYCNLKIACSISAQFKEAMNSPEIAARLGLRSVHTARILERIKEPISERDNGTHGLTGSHSNLIIHRRFRESTVAFFLQLLYKSRRKAEMRIWTYLLAFVPLLIGCASSNVSFIQTDELYVPRAKPEGTEILLLHGRVKRPHRVIGIIEAELNRTAHRGELDALLVKKAREIGADGVMLVDYDVDRAVYFERHHALVGRGPWRRHVVASRKRVEVRKTASGIAFVLE